MTRPPSSAPAARRVVAALGLVLAVAAASLLTSTTAGAATGQFTFSGVAYDQSGVGDVNAKISIYPVVAAGAPDAALDESDGLFYGPYHRYDAGNGGGYSVFLTPGSYKVLYEDFQSSPYTTFLTHITVTTTNVTLDVHLKAHMVCTSSQTTLTGTPRVGQPLTATATAFFNPTYPTTVAYQWRELKNGAVTYLVGARGLTYTPTPADVGAQLLLDVTGVSDYGPAGCLTTVSGVVAAGTQTQAQGVPPSGSAKVGKTLTSPAVALPAGGSAGYQWFRVVKKKHHRTVTRAIGGATAAAYRLTKHDRGAKVYVAAIVTAPGYTSSTMTSGQRKVH